MGEIGYIFGKKWQKKIRWTALSTTTLSVIVYSSSAIYVDVKGGIDLLICTQMCVHVCQICEDVKYKKVKTLAQCEIRTRICRFRVRHTDHYTTMFLTSKDPPEH